MAVNVNLFLDIIGNSVERFLREQMAGIRLRSIRILRNKKIRQEYNTNGENHSRNENAAKMDFIHLTWKRSEAEAWAKFPAHPGSAKSDVTSLTSS